MARVKYPKIHAVLSGGDSNAFFILARVQKAMERGKVPKKKIEEFMKEAKSSDYDHLLATCMAWVDCS